MDRPEDDTPPPANGDKERRPPLPPLLWDVTDPVQALVYARLRAALREPPPADDPGQATITRRLARRLGVI